MRLFNEILQWPDTAINALYVKKILHPHTSCITACHSIAAYIAYTIKLSPEIPLTKSWDLSNQITHANILGKPCET